MARGAATVVVNIIGKADKLKESLDQADKDLGGFSGKLDEFGKKTMVTGAKFTAGLTLPIVGGLGLATKAAMEDEEAQARLAKTLENTVGATDAVVRSVEAQIAKMMQASTFADDELRPAYENLVRETRNVKEANELMTTAMDLAAAKGISVEAASEILVKAHNGQTRALKELGVETKNTEGTAASYADIMKDVNQVVGGAAAAATETAAGKTKILQRDMGELVETLGVALVPIMEKVVGWVSAITEKFASLSPGVQTAILVVAGLAAAIGPLITVVGALATALAFLAANPVVLIVAAIAALAAGFVIAYQKSETFRDIVNAVIQAVVNYFLDQVGFFLDAVAMIIGGFAKMADAASHLPFIGDKFDGVAKSLRNAQKDVEGFADAAHKGIDLVVGDAERATEEFRKLGLMSAGLNVGAPMVRTPGGALARAAGGPVWPGQAFLVGERGPELFVPGQVGSIVPGGGGSGGGGTTVIQLVLDGKVVTEVVHNGMLEKQRRTGSLGLS